VLIAIGIDWDGRRQVLAVELADRESRSSWRDFLLELKARGLHGVAFVVADDHGAGSAARGSGGGGRSALLCAFLKKRARLHAAQEPALAKAGVDDDCLQELRWLGACPRAGEAGPAGPPRPR
jgi:putative transposase